MLKKEDCMHSEDWFLSNSKEVLVEIINYPLFMELGNKMIKISNKIHRSNRRNRADTIKFHPSNHHLIDLITHVLPNSFIQMNKLEDAETPKDIIFLEASFVENLKFIFLFDEPPIENQIPTLTIKLIKDCTKDEVENYKMGCRGYVNIKI